MGQYAGANAVSNDQRVTNREFGFSIVELMVALVLSLFLIGGVTLTYLSGRAASVEAEELGRMQENVRFASDFLVRDIRNAGFRDQLTLTFDQYKEIGTTFAQLNQDKTQLTIRYAGRGACGRVFGTDTELKLIENTYSVDVESGLLRCTGTEKAAETTIETDGTLTVTYQETTEPDVALAAGLASIEFEFIPDPDALICNFFDPIQDLPTACLGVNIFLTFQGQPERTAKITSAFRNVIFDIVFKRETF